LSRKKRRNPIMEMTSSHVYVYGDTDADSDWIKSIAKKKRFVVRVGKLKKIKGEIANPRK
jgi:hypothetical protein